LTVLLFKEAYQREKDSRTPNQKGQGQDLSRVEIKQRQSILFIGNQGTGVGSPYQGFFFLEEVVSGLDKHIVATPL
jgi:hypothetical protein